MPPLDFLRSRLERELLEEQAELAEIIKLQELSERQERLLALANKIGASTVGFVKGYGLPTQPELIHNIEGTLQTKAMIATVRTTSNYVVTTVVLAIIALGSMIATWIAVLKR